VVLKRESNTLERGHGLSSVWRHNSLQKRNRSCQLLFRQESQDSDLRQSAIVDLGDKPPFLGLLAAALAETKGIKQVQRDRVGDLVRIRKLGEFSRLSTLHVMSSVGLREVFQETNEENDLPLCGIGKSVPLLRWGSGFEGIRGSVQCHGSRPVDSVGLDNVSDKGSHGHTAVLDLRMTQESDGSSLVATPNGSVGQLQRIVVLQQS
jgi:hypothetical protein